MGWLVLSGAPGSSGYDNELQLVRHNGTEGEATPWVSGVTSGYPGSSGAGIQWADPFVFVSYTSGTLNYTIDRVALDSWPPTRQTATFIEAGTPRLNSLVFKDGTAFRALGGNYAGGTTPYAATSIDGLLFYTRRSFNGANSWFMAQGKNGRFVFGDGAKILGGNPIHTLHYTDNYIDFYTVNIPLVGVDTPISRAGTSGGIWALSFYINTTNTYTTYYSNDNLATFSSIVSPGLHRIWAHGTTLYGAIGGRVYSSTDGATWTDRGLPFGAASIAVLDLTYDGTSAFLLVGALGYAVTTTDFATYTPLPGYDFAGHTLFGAIYIADATLYPSEAVIQGTLRLDTSDGAFAARDVYLYDYVNGKKIAETVSNGTTGVWQFTQVAPGEYFVVGVAHGDDLNIPRDFDALGVITVV